MDDKPNWFPWWLKIIVGITGIGLLYKFYSLVEAMSVFFAICAVPFGVLFSLNLITQGTYELIANPPWFRDLTSRLRGFRDNLKASETESLPSPA